MYPKNNRNINLSRAYWFSTAVFPCVSLMYLKCITHFLKKIFLINHQLLFRNISDRIKQITV